MKLIMHLDMLMCKCVYVYYLELRLICLTRKFNQVFLDFPMLQFDACFYTTNDHFKNRSPQD